MVEREHYMNGWTPEEQAYSLWIRAAREQQGTAVRLATAVVKHLRKAHGLKPDASLREIGVNQKIDGSTIGRWERGTGATKPQPQYPNDPLAREALVAVVTRLAPTPPASMQWASFKEVCEAFDRQRQVRIERGSGNLESHAAQERIEERHQILATWPAPARDIDPIKLGLGSWAFDGGLPPYLHRTADNQLAAMLDSPGITTVAGAPKSGKSRSILEVLQRRYPEGLTWWVNPSPTVLPSVVESAQRSKGNERPTFIVLDDAGLIGTDPTTGLTAQRLADLAASCVHVIVVIHTQTLASWEHRNTNRTTDDFGADGIGASWELIDLLGQKICYGSVLDEDEAATSTTAYKNADVRVQSFDLTRLAETLAGVEALRKQAHALLETPVSIQAALLEASIDASITFPTGASQDVLGTLAKIHYRRRQPNRPWREHLLDDAFDAITTGITAGSPHAILTTTDQKTYRLLDALVPELRKPERQIEEILDSLKDAVSIQVYAQAAYDAGHWHYHNGNLQSAQQSWERAVRSGNLHAMNRLGVSARFDNKDEEAARYWFSMGAESGDEQSMVNLGLALLSGDDIASACDWWHRAVEKFGNTNAMLCLGHAARRSGDLEKAEFWWKQAVERGDADAMTNMGNAAYRTGHHETARAWWERAVKAGAQSGMIELGIFMLDDIGDHEAARKLWTLAAEAGNAQALYHLGCLAHDQGDLDIARGHWRKAAAGGHARAMLILGASFHEAGDTAQTRKWWKLAAQNGELDAKYHLGQLEQEVGNLSDAAFWWADAAKGGHSNAMFNLGVMREIEGELSAAQDLWQKAAEAGHTKAMFRVGQTAYKAGDFNLANRWWLKAEEGGDTAAMVELGALALEQAMDTDRARDWWERAAEAGETDAMFNLGAMSWNGGDLVGARTWWKRAATGGHSQAIAQIARFSDQLGITAESTSTSSSGQKTSRD